MKAVIFDIERCSFSNGPGIRTTVFFKGCNLSCAWCHNPESQSFNKEIMFYSEKCTSCGRCADLSCSDEDFLCYNNAKEICGREYTVSSLMEEIVKDKSFYENSKGGVTFSGGECMLQLPFLTEISKKCREEGIHTAVDTAGNVPWESFEKVLPYTDLFLYDIKHMDSELHKKYTGAGNELILENLARLMKSGASVWVRYPLVPGVNNSEDIFTKLRDFFEKNACPSRLELLNYHATGEHKYRALGKNVQSFPVPSNDEAKRLYSIVFPGEAK